MSEDRETIDPATGPVEVRHAAEEPAQDGQKASPVPAPGAAEEQAAADEAVRSLSRRHTRRSFTVAAAAAAAGFGLVEWVKHGRQEQMQPALLRKAFEADAKLSRLVFHDRALAPTYPVGRSESLRINGVVGLKNNLLLESWRLQLVGVARAQSYAQYVPDVTKWVYRYTEGTGGEDQGHDSKTAPKDQPQAQGQARPLGVSPAGVAPSVDTAEKMAPKPMVAQVKVLEEPAGKEDRGNEEAGQSDSTLDPDTPGLLLTIADILKLPMHEMVTQFKCIEGWSQIVRWRGVRMADFIDAYPPQRKADGTLPRYVYMETPNGDYYVGYDLSVCRHPQTLLVTEMAGRPLTQTHGAPLRLHTPTKYGYKQIKRIGLIAYTDTRPDDYWTKLGYDWYAGL